MNILITGGTGLLGGAAARRLHRDGHQVTVIGRNKRIGEALTKEGICFAPIDLAEDTAATLATCRDQQAIIHCAALASPWGPYESFFRANVLGTKNILTACKNAGVKRFVNISSPSLYFDYRDRFDIKESDPLPSKQVTHYGETKRLADREVDAAFREGLETISLRPRAVFGPGDSNILGRLLRSAKKGYLPVVNGGTSYIDMTFIDNAVDSMVLALQAPKKALGQTFNITNGEPSPSREIFQRLFRKLNHSVKFIPLPYFAAYGLAKSLETYYQVAKIKTEPPITRYAIGLMSRSQTLDIGLAKKVLGYQPKISLDEGLDRFATWWKTQ